MTRIEFYVKGSSIDPYKVVFEKIAGNLNAFCTCPAGSNGQVCKHRMRLLSGNAEGLIKGDLALLGTIVDWLVGTDVELALREVALAEDRHSRAAEELFKAKKKLAVSLRS
ncbi:SWIM zinc finger family protein [Cognatiluteimonas profundi]|uniref:SWIM zinc finger family protein n=1 Tax=Cognatiluteimonas profundi TaxID=2594501 RepID=UPI00131EAB2D|nr:SWIM zinc finger family protein [Lysobacter profundi]